MDNPSSTGIEASGLTKRFGDLVAVAGLDLSVRPGEIFGLVGPDGAGKTTTIRMLAGIMAPDSGSIQVAGYDVIANPEAVKSSVSYMPQRFGLYEDLSVEENIRFYADLFGVPRRLRQERTQQLLAMCGMSPFRRRLAGQLSGGMKQKLGLVCALIHTPRVLLLDEPTNGVDPISRREFWGMLYGLLDQGVAILNSTAYLDEAERCHRLALIHRGTLLRCDTPQALKESLPGAVLAVTSAEPRRVRDHLAGRPGISSIMIAGDSVHVFVDSAARAPDLRAALDAGGIAYDAIEQVAPTIEDLFITTLEGAQS